MTAPLTSLYGRPIRVTATGRLNGAAVALVGARVMAVQLTAAAATATLALSDAADGSNPLIDLQTPLSGESRLFDFSELGGVPFAVDVFCTLGGAGAIAQVWTTRRV